jgi:hypothetical protein
MYFNHANNYWVAARVPRYEAGKRPCVTRRLPVGWVGC